MVPSPRSINAAAWAILRFLLARETPRQCHRAPRVSAAEPESLTQAREVSYENVRGNTKTAFAVIGDDYWSDGTRDRLAMPPDRERQDRGPKTARISGAEAGSVRAAQPSRRKT
jgi:hypothetical protein